MFGHPLTIAGVFVLWPLFKTLLETNFSTVEEVEDQSAKSFPATVSLKLTWVHSPLSKRKRS